MWICTNLPSANVSRNCENWGVNLAQRWWMLHLPEPYFLTPCVLVFKGGIYHLCPTIYSSVFTFSATYLQWPNLYQSFCDRLVLVCKHLTSRPCFEVKVIQFLKNFYEEELEFQAEGNTFALLNQQERLVVNDIRFTSWSNRPVSNNLLLIHT